MKKWIAILISALLCLSLLTACGSTETTASDSETDTDAASEAVEETAEDEEDEEDEGALFEDEEIVVYMMVTNCLEDADDVEAKINEIVGEKLGLTVTLNCYGMGDYATQLSLAISGGEQIDLACLTPLPGSNFSSITSSGQAMDISGMLEEYCPDVLAVMGDYIDAFKLNDSIYGLPVARQKSSNMYFRYRSDLAEELGLTDTILNASSYNDMTEVFQTVLDEGGISPLGGSKCLNGRADFFWSQDSFTADPYDTIGDSLYLVYGTDDGKAASILENEEYLYMVKLFAEWNEDNFVWGDTLTNADLSATQLIDSGICFGEFVATEVGNDVDGYTANAANYPCTYQKIGIGMVSTSAVTIWATFVPVTAKAPEAALAFVNELYTNSELMNTIIYGVEGQNYILNDDGTASYPEGTSAENCGFHNNDWMIGNSFIMAPWDDQGADFRTLAQEDLANSVVSPYMGFALDTTELSDTIAALSSVYEEYGNTMLCGGYTDDLMSEFQQKLDAAGLDGYIEAIQSQLDAWSAD